MTALPLCHKSKQINSAHLTLHLARVVTAHFEGVLPPLRVPRAGALLQRLSLVDHDRDMVSLDARRRCLRQRFQRHICGLHHVRIGVLEKVQMQLLEKLDLTKLGGLLAALVELPVNDMGVDDIYTDRPVEQ
ncbi:hypothetical protein PPTG_02006 [Phytophthora nicotianae INRA-310]|uniref:Uncharacterized protein n=1 Tax=Phytophthora nicotianae (strain INRA-310) TaxID=761204 RepID=W2RB69_PHYN3|nr:hypothetical protein PPTG_02006 [Phytophthora nicotianae INRA-310]ETN21939.1 hypothetical protein PPTG_02006 [Phytophthora nicotianae INRA-310]